MRRILFLAIALGLLATGCQVNGQAERRDSAAPASPAEVASFELEGVVVEASGSLAAVESERRETNLTPRPTVTQVPASPTPGGAKTTPSPVVTSSPREVMTQRTTVIERGTPGSVTVRIEDFRGAGDCIITENDLLVFTFTKRTEFKPDVTQAKDFPNSLKGRRIHVVGRVEDVDECVFVAERISLLEDADSSRSPASSRESPTPSPTSS